MEKGKIAALDKPRILKETIGGQPAIHVRVKEAQTRKALTILKEYGGILVGDEIRISAKNPWEIMTKVSNTLGEHEVLTEKIEVVEPTLEDVFLKLSGRRLTEEGN
jgi:ABC-2 type transport system ATP-binding protein